MQTQMQVRGSVLRARKSFSEEHFGSGAWDRLLDTLPESDRTVLRGILLPAGWFPFEISERLHRAIVDVLGKGDPKVFEDIGRKSARENLSGIHKTFLAAGNPRPFSPRPRPSTSSITIREPGNTFPRGRNPAFSRRSTRRRFQSRIA